jgi:3-oxoacyl-[acyl-carrier-protein] synthase-3
MAGVGILGIGVCLPDEIRTNDWWPEDVVLEWRERAARNREIGERLAERAPLSEGARRVVSALARLADDPFQGAVERRVHPAEKMSSEMEIAAAEEAIRKSGIDRREIDVVLTYSTVPDVLSAPNACVVHRELGLSERCLATSVEAVCNAFLMQLCLAEKLVASAEARYALLVQSNNVWRLLPPTEPYSAWSGDGATAVVLGPVPPGSGLLTSVHRADGRQHDGMVTSVPGARWFEQGRAYWFPQNSASARDMLLCVPDRARQVLHEALEQAELSTGDVDFFACHQATSWFVEVAQEHAGLGRAKTVNTFSWTGSLFSANLPLQLSIAEREGLLRAGDVVAMHSGGSGVTWSAAMMRWGTA